MKKEPTFRELCEEIIKAARQLWEKGWTCRNTCTISARLTPGQLDEDFFRGGNWTETGVRIPETAGDYYLVAGTGACFHGNAPDRKDCLGVVEINPSGESFRLIWGMKETGRPMSGFPTHLHCHGVRRKAAMVDERIVIHARCPGATALSYSAELDTKSLSKLVWEMHPESVAVLPRGCGMITGVASEDDLGTLVAEGMQRQAAALMQYRGVIASGATTCDALALIETVEHAADVYLKTSVCGGNITKPSKKYILSIAARHGIEPDPAVLDLLE